MTSFTAYRIHEIERRIVARFDTITLDDLGPGDVVVRVQYSCINYKDALAATGAGRILRKYPLVGGIDLAGEVVSSSDRRFAPGQAVLVNGCGLSETHDGGYAEYARLNGDWVVPVPAGLTALDAMKIGTAGYTAALAIHQMERNGQAPANGPVVVTGATGGVGSVAIDMLAGRGYEVVAVSGKPESDDYLRAIGAARVLRRQEVDLGTRPMEKAQWAGAIDNVGGDLLAGRGYEVVAVSGKPESDDYLRAIGAARVLRRQEVDLGTRPMEKAQWAGAIDNVGGDLLAWLTRTTDQWGNIASVGLAGGAELKTTVMPFILRGVNLLGINSVLTPRATRLAVWERIAGDLRPRHLDRIAERVVPLAGLPAQFDDYLKGRVTGRTVVKIA